MNIDRSPHTVVGVVPALLDLGIPTAIRSARVWVPVRANASGLARDDRSWVAFARLGAGVGSPPLELPFQFSSRLGRAGLERLADVIEGAL